jgi:hypothetical protein
MRSRIAGLALAMVGATWVAAVGCSDSSGGGTTGKGGSGGKAGGTAGSAGSSAGTSGAGTSGAGTSGGGTGGSSAAGTGGTGGTAGGAGTGGTGGSAAGTGGGGGTAPSMPFETVNIPSTSMIAAPAGASIKLKAHAVGSQIYTCTAMAVATDGGTDGGADGGADAGSTYSWVLKAPDAKLYDENGAEIGAHFAGPTWLYKADQSALLGSKIGQQDSTLSDAIPWLLLKAAAHMGAGNFADITYVQRVNTRKGKAPATGCDATTVGTDTAVAYTADYYFLTGGATALNPEWPFATVSIPTDVAAPSGTTFKLKYHGWGDQVYTCTASGGADAGADAGAAMYTWVLKAPAATLYDENNVKKGTHTMGPTWTSTDTSSIVGAKTGQANSPLSDAIPWLLLKVSSHAGGTGVFSDVTYVQRLNTTLGKAPATGCDAAHVNAETSVHYSADYYYYTGDTPVDGGADGG